MSEQDYECLEAPEDVSSYPDPGQLVRQTREQRGLSFEDMSARTRLTEHVLSMVEQGDYRGMGEPVYARGYYRKCAEALGLNGDLLVEAYEHHSGTNSPVPTIDQRPSIAYREGPGGLALGVAVGLIVVVFAASGLWLWLKDDGASGVARAAAPPLEPVATAMPANALRHAAQEQTQTKAQLQVADGSASESLPREQIPEPAPTALVAAVAAATPQPRVATPEPSAAPDAAPQRPQVRLEVQGGEAWADVRDPSGNKLLYKLLQAGAVREFSGQPPFKVALGRADNVRLWVQGQPVPFEAQIENDLRAFFYIDAEGRVSDEVTP